MLVRQMLSIVMSKRKAKSNCSIYRFFSDESKSKNEKIPIPIDRQRFLRQSQGLHALCPEECPENPTIILFPGQGSQFVGMAKSLADIPEAKDIFDIASDVLRFL